MKRRELLAAACALATGTGVRAHASSGVRRVVFAFGATDAGRERFVRMFAEHGFVAGRNLVLEFVDVIGSRAPEQEKLAQDVVASRPDVIALPALEPLFLFQRLTRDIPIVFYNYGADPVRVGLVASLRRPGGNITGTTQLLTQMLPKSMALLKELRPRGRHSAMLMTEDAAQAPHIPLLREVHAAAAQELGLTTAEILLPDPASLETVRALVGKADFLIIDNSVYRMPWMDAFLQHLIEIRTPALYLLTEMVRRGGLLSVTADFAEGQKMGIAIVARILRGESPATIPVHQVTRYRTAINLRTASAMGIEVPPSVVIQANEVIR